MSFKVYVKSIAKEEGKTLSSIANDLHISRQTISRWIDKPWLCSIQDIKALSVILDLHDEQETKLLALAMNANEV